MGSSYLLNAEPLDEALVHRWAYDSDAELIEQDEDLLLHDWDYTEVLLAAIADPACPKAGYIMGVWDDFTRSCTIHKRPADIAAVRDALQKAQGFRGDPWIARWIADQERRLSFVEGVGPVRAEDALQMAEILLNGMSGYRPIAIRCETATTYELELSVPGGLHREWLSVDKSSGRFRYSRYWPEGRAEPMWFDPIG